MTRDHRGRQPKVRCSTPADDRKRIMWLSTAAVALAMSGGGALGSFETTVLLTVEETMDALRKAEQVQYRPPGA